MPQASSELQQQMNTYFGDSISDAGPIKFLEDAGYELLKGFVWKPKEGVKTLKDMTRKEFECLLFLVHEWDFGEFVK
jgi:hypothetical protein